MKVFNKFRLRCKTLAGFEQQVPEVLKKIFTKARKKSYSEERINKEFTTLVQKTVDKVCVSEIQRNAIELIHYNVVFCENQILTEIERSYNYRKMSVLTLIDMKSTKTVEALRLLFLKKKVPKLDMNMRKIFKDILSLYLNHREALQHLNCHELDKLLFELYVDNVRIPYPFSEAVSTEDFLYIMSLAQLTTDGQDIGVFLKAMQIYCGQSKRFRNLLSGCFDPMSSFLAKSMIQNKKCKISPSHYDPQRISLSSSTIPTDLLVNIAFFMDGVSLAKMSQVSKEWNQISQRGDIWKRLCQSSRKLKPKGNFRRIKKSKKPPSYYRSSESSSSESSGESIVAPTESPISTMDDKHPGVATWKHQYAYEHHEEKLHYVLLRKCNIIKAASKVCAGVYAANVRIKWIMAAQQIVNYHVTTFSAWQNKTSDTRNKCLKSLYRLVFAMYSIVENQDAKKTETLYMLIVNELSNSQRTLPTYYTDGLLGKLSTDMIAKIAAIDGVDLPVGYVYSVIQQNDTSSLVGLLNSNRALLASVHLHSGALRIWILLVARWHQNKAELELLKLILRRANIEVRRWWLYHIRTQMPDNPDINVPKLGWAIFKDKELCDTFDNISYVILMQTILTTKSVYAKYLRKIVSILNRTRVPVNILDAIDANQKDVVEVIDYYLNDTSAGYNIREIFPELHRRYTIPYDK